jgi:outer membrane lipoprotein SlyB
MFKKSMMVMAVAAMVSGCQSTGQEYQADVFDASQVNLQQEAKTVKIITVSPTKIKVSNERNKKAAMMIGGVLGALGGAALGSSNNRDTAIVGGVAGGATGALAGSLVNDTTLVPGVLIGYSEEGKIFTSAQVGRVCEFALGEISLMVKTSETETRIQPNATCPEPVKG